MSNAQLDAVIDGIGRLYAGWGRETSIIQMRRQWDAFLSHSRIPAEVEGLDANGVSCRWVMGAGARRARVILYLHGGGYQIGSAISHHNVMARLSQASRCHVLGVNYRLAPEHRFPAPIDDVLAAYQWLLDQGIQPSNIAFCGDSAGGGLAIAVLVALRDRRMPLPAAAATMSPWVDLEATGNSYVTHADSDPVTQRAMIALMAKTYMGKTADLRDPLASPIHANLAGLPPLLIQVGEREVLLDDARTLAQRAQAAGVMVHFKIWDGMIHTFQLFAGRLQEADAAIREVGEFLNEKLGRLIAPSGR